MIRSNENDGAKKTDDAFSIGQRFGIKAYSKLGRIQSMFIHERALILTINAFSCLNIPTPGPENVRLTQPHLCDTK